MPPDVTKAGTFLRCRAAIFPRYPYGGDGKQLGCAGTSNDWTDPDGKNGAVDRKG